LGRGREGEKRGELGREKGKMARRERNGKGRKVKERGGRRKGMKKEGWKGKGGRILYSCDFSIGKDLKYVNIK